MWDIGYLGPKEVVHNHPRWLRRSSIAGTLCRRGVVRNGNRAKKRRELINSRRAIESSRGGVYGWGHKRWEITAPTEGAPIPQDAPERSLWSTTASSKTTSTEAPVQKLGHAFVDRDHSEGRHSDEHEGVEPLPVGSQTPHNWRGCPFGPTTNARTVRVRGALHDDPKDHCRPQRAPIVSESAKRVLSGVDTPAILRHTRARLSRERRWRHHPPWREFTT